MSATQETKVQNEESSDEIENKNELITNENGAPAAAKKKKKKKKPTNATNGTSNEVTDTNQVKVVENKLESLDLNNKQAPAGEEQDEEDDDNEDDKAENPNGGTGAAKKKKKKKKKKGKL